MQRNLILSALLLVGAITACSKTESATATGSDPKGGGIERIGVPTSGGMRGVKGHGDVFGEEGAIGGAPGGVRGSSSELTAEEGKITMEPPADLKAGAASVGKLHLVPAKGYDVNVKYTFKLNLTPPAGVSVEKALLKGGGHDGAGDAEKLELTELIVPVKLTADKAGAYAIGGQFEFAICKEDACITKHVPVTLQIAAK
jgi:hypothetical protein